MTGCPPNEPALQQFIAEIGAISPRPHHSALLAAAGRLVPDCGFSYATTRRGWYRPGGVIRPDGTRIADDLESWAEAELEACGGDMDALIDRYAGEGLLVTRQSGLTHYFAAPFGPDAADFIQLEIEELQELVDRLLIHPERPPTDLQELTDPFTPLMVEPRPLGPSRYHFRRITDMRQVVARQAEPIGGQSPLGRFMAEWNGSSAGARNHFCEYWIVAVREHLDRYRNTVLSASPVSLHGRKLKFFQWNHESRGVELSNQLLAFNRAAGYPFAWYFHMVAGALVPRDVVFRAAQDMEAGFSYLPDADIVLLKGWVNSPYAV
jgi:hypothetical protein